MRLDATLVRIVLVPTAMKPLATELVAGERAEPLATAPAAEAGRTFASGTGPPTELHLTLRPTTEMMKLWHGGARHERGGVIAVADTTWKL